MKERMIRSDFLQCELPDILNQDDLLKYFDQMKKGNVEARKIIIESNIRLVLNRVYTLYSNTSYEVEDLVGVGLIGLIYAADNYKPELNYKFSTYVIHCVDLEILKYMSYQWKKTCLEEDEEIDSEYPDFNYSVSNSYENKMLYKAIRNIISEFSEFEQDVIYLYYGFFDAPMSQADIARKYNVTRSYISSTIIKSTFVIKEKLNKQGFIELNSHNKFKTHTSNRSRKKLSIYELFEEDRSQIDKIIENLSDKEQEIIKLRDSENWNPKYSYYYYQRIIPKIKQELKKQKEYKKIRKR